MNKNNEKTYLIPSRQVSIEDTTYCGASCIMCPREKAHHKWEHMSMDMFIRAVEEAVALDVLSLSMSGFGDCFIDPQLGEKLKYIKTKHPHIKIICSSTCHLIKGKNLQLLSDYVDTLKISMYGITKSTYEKVHRGSVKFEDAMENILNILALPKDKRPYMRMAYLILPENEHELEQWKDFWAPKVDEIVVWLPHNFSGAYRPAKDVTSEDANKIKSCGRPFAGNYIVRTDGEVSACCFDYNRELIIGDLKRQSFKEILLGDKLKRLREVHESCDFANSEFMCKDCDQIRDRSHALVYASDKKRKIGVISTHPDLICDYNDYSPKKETR